MSDVFQISVSGLRAFQSKLSTVSQNIANANTPGYSRQSVDFATRTPSYSGIGYIGSGVQATGIRREVDGFVQSQLVSNTGLFAQLDELHSLSSQIDNLVADPVAGLAPSMQNFFDAVQGVADDPSSLAARQVLIGQTEALTSKFDSFDRRFDGLLRDANSSLEVNVAEINSIAANIANVNRQIAASPGDQFSKPPNDLLDKRDQLLLDLSQNVSVSTVMQNDGSLNVFIGSGQALVVGFEAQTLSTANNPFDPSRLDIFVSVGNSTANITQQLSGGKIGAINNFIDGVLTPSRNALGRIALGLADTVNAQHRLGQDLDGALGGDFFNAVNSNGFGSSVFDSPTNSVAGFGNISAAISDVSNLTTSDYQLRSEGADQYVLTRLSDNTKFNIDASGGYPFTSAEIDGFNVTINAASGSGDLYVIKPTAEGLGGLRLAITDPRQIAAALPVIGESNINNTGTAAIGATSVSNTASYVAGTYNITLGNSTVAAANGTTIGAINDNNSDSTLQYELSINGTTIYTQTEANPQLADLTALQGVINGATATTGVRAYVNAAGTSLILANDPASSVNINITETLNTTAGTVEAGDTVTGYFGSTLTGTANTASLTYNSPADSYIVLDSSNTAVADGSYVSGSTISFNGIDTSVSGTANSGDQFSVQQNTGGVSDNRNMLLLGNFQNTLILNGGTSSLNEAYGNLVADIGTQTRTVELTRDAQEVLLNQSIEARESVSGVNLDEEAANLLQFQQAYQAMSQLILAADRMFQTIIGVVGR